jgi:hypothetical protein
MLPAGTRCPTRAATSNNGRSARSTPRTLNFLQPLYKQAQKTRPLVQHVLAESGKSGYADSVGTHLRRAHHTLPRSIIDHVYEDLAEQSNAPFVHHALRRHPSSHRIGARTTRAGGT